MGGHIILKAVIAISFMANVKAELKVKQVHVLFRHGERTPVESEMYPTDIYNVSTYEPWGLAQLTNTGKMREYKVGQLLKTRYQELLGEHYIPSAVYAISTVNDRTKASLQLVLAGLFPPSGIQTWNSELPWIPIPTHYVPEPLDIVMKAHLCPQYQDELSRVRQSPEVQAKVSVHNDFFKFLTDKAGRNLTELDKVYQIYNLLISQKAMNLTLPEWCTDAVVQQLSEITVLEYQIRSYTTKLRRLLGGPMVRRFIENMHLDGAQDTPRKIYLYSGHELSITSYLQAHGISEPKLPLYGTAVMIEKLEDTDGKLFVRLVLWTGVTEQLITLRVPGCEEICPIERYLQLTRDVIPSDEDMDCLWRHLSARELRNILYKEINYDYQFDLSSP